MELESEIINEKDKRYAAILDKRGWIYLETQYLKYGDRPRASKLVRRNPAEIALDNEGKKDLEWLLTLKEWDTRCVHSGRQIEAHPFNAELEWAIKTAISEAKNVVPVMPVTDFEKAAYAEEQEALEAVANHGAHPCITKGKSYKINTTSYHFRKQFKRKMVHYDEETKTTSTKMHDCELSGQDKAIVFVDDNGDRQIFRDQPQLNNPREHDESELWKFFKEPDTKTIKDLHPKQWQENMEHLDLCETLGGFTYYPGQKDYIARVGIKDHMLIGADVGTGKTLMAISLAAMKEASRVLIVAPRGVMKDDSGDPTEEVHDPSHWIKELDDFAPFLEKFKIFSRDDYVAIKNANGGKLPPGVYISYYQCMFSNRSMESIPKSWDDATLAKKLQVPKLPANSANPTDGWARSIGQEKDGIRCVVSPCLASEIGDQFDMVIYDEAHLLTNLDAHITQMAIRMQPKYRYALTATPIPNVVTNLFSLMGWVVVDDWYKGNRMAPDWPFYRGDLSRFAEAFMCKEQDFTKEKIKLQKSKTYKPVKCIKNSPAISSPARLLKLLKPNMAYISKDVCNPKLVDREVIDIRVPMGHHQAKLYAYFCDRGNIPGKDPFAVHRRQAAYLRGICADPANFNHGDASTPEVHSNMNPKIIAILELVRDMIHKQEQCVIVYSRLGQANEIAARLEMAGVSYSRIDGTTTERHTHESNEFKSGRTQVMLMGIRCAMGHSYPSCPNLIIGSLEYSYGTFHQALGRVWRVNSQNDVKVYVILHEKSIEELLFDIVATKADAATICLQGNRVPNDFKPVDATEVLASAMSCFTDSLTKDEDECEKEWPALQASITAALTAPVTV